MRIVLSAVLLLSLAGCQSASNSVPATPVANTGASPASTVDSPANTGASPAKAGPAAAEPVQGYVPEGREEFVFAEKEPSSQVQGYDRFCKSIGNCATLPYAKYVGMRGYFVTENPSAHAGFDYYPVTLQNGEFLYYRVQAGSGRFKIPTPIARYRQFSGEATVWSDPLVPGSSIQLQGTEVVDGSAYYRLSNEKQISEAQLDLLREAAARFGNKAPAVAGLLLDLDIQKDDHSKHIFINPKGSVLRSEARLYLALDETRSAFRMVIKYYDAEWLFVNRFSARADGYHTRTPELAFRRDHAAGEGWESIDLAVGKRELELAHHLGHAKRSAIQFEGSKGVVEKVLEDDQKAGLRQMLQLHALINTESAVK
jgi:hypothetical protein